MSLVLLCGCSAQQAGPGAAQVPPAPTQPPVAPQAPAPPQPPVQAPPPQAMQPPPQQQAPANQFDRGKYLARPTFQQGGGRDSLVSQYGKYRIDKAREIKNYAPVSVVPIGLDAFLKSYWDQGYLHIRVAMVGPEQNLQLFVRDQREVKVSFTNQAGIILKDYVIPMTEFHQARGSANFGTPTFEFESNVELPLEVYEQFFQWTFEWS